MKFKFFAAFIAVISLFIVSCGNDLTSDMVKEIQPTGDQIAIKSDTFHIVSQTFSYPSIVSRPDSFLLGSYLDKVYGNTRGDILTQLYYPDKYRYMNPAVADTQPDSVVLSLGFYGNNYFGDPNSLLEFRIYELKNALTKDKSDINPNEFADFTNLWGYHVAPVSQADTYTYGTNVYRRFNIKMSPEFLTRFYNNGNDDNFQSKEKFLEFFKGLYITTKLGSSTLINLTQIELTMYGHYTYKTDANKGEKVKFTLRFPVTGEVKSVNRIQHSVPNNNLLTNKDTTYVSSPANYYAQFTVPIDRMRKRISVGDKNLVVNSAILRLDLYDPVKMGTKLFYNRSMLLVKGTKEDVDKFFTGESTVDNINSFIVKLDRENITSTTYNYFYTFSALGKMIQTEIERKTNPVSELNMVLVPVKLVYDNNTGAVTNILPDYSMGAAAFNSGKNKANPLKIDVVYSGF